MTADELVHAVAARHRLAEIVTVPGDVWRCTCGLTVHTPYGHDAIADHRDHQRQEVGKELIRWADQEPAS